MADGSEQQVYIVLEEEADNSPSVPKRNWIVVRRCETCSLGIDASELLSVQRHQIRGSGSDELEAAHLRQGSHPVAFLLRHLAEVVKVDGLEVKNIAQLLSDLLLRPLPRLSVLMLFLLRLLSAKTYRRT